METDPDHGISTLADLFADDVIVKGRFRAEDHAVILVLLDGLRFLILNWGFPLRALIFL